MTWRPPYRDSQIHVAATKCSTCIFRPGNPMSLRPGRVKTMVDESVADGGAIWCHKTLAYSPSFQGEQLDGAICRGFLDAYADEVPGLQLGIRMGVIKEVPVP